MIRVFFFVSLLALDACVVMTPRTFRLMKQGENSIGFMRGISACSEIVSQRDKRKFTPTELHDLFEDIGSENKD